MLRIEIGLKLKSSVLSRDLYIGITFATLRSSGKTPVSTDLLIMHDKGLIYSSMYGFSSLAGRLSHPEISCLLIFYYNFAEFNYQMTHTYNVSFG